MSTAEPDLRLCVDASSHGGHGVKLLTQGTIYQITFSVERGKELSVQGIGLSWLAKRFEKING